MAAAAAVPESGGARPAGLAALAVALGIAAIGAVLLWMPQVASADTGDSRHRGGAGAGRAPDGHSPLPARASGKGRPGRAVGPQAFAPSRSGAVVAGPGSLVRGPTTPRNPSPRVAPVVGLQTMAGDPAGGFLRSLFGDGTLDHPDAGILAGNGFSYNGETCPGTTACAGGDAGLFFGNGGNGFNGGDGGSAGWFGAGGNGGPGVPGGEGGTGGRGGLFLGDGGDGGPGGAAVNPGGPGGNGGAGGHAGTFSLLGTGGDGGAGAGGADGATVQGGTGGDGGAGGDGSLVWGAGGAAGDGGPGGDSRSGSGGSGGAAGVPGSGRILLVLTREGAAGADGVDGLGLDDLLVYFLDHTAQTPNVPTGYGVIGEFGADERAALTADGRIVGETVGLKNNDGTDGYSLWPFIDDLFTSSAPVPDADKPALAATILSRVQLYPGLDPSSEFPSPAEGTPTSQGGYVFWAQDFEFTPGKAPTDEAYAGVLAVMWAGKQILGDAMTILPVPSSSLFKTLGSATGGPYVSSHIINGDGTKPYLSSLGLTDLPAGTDGEWNFLSLAYANGLIDGFFGQQYNSAFTGKVTPDTRLFYSDDLPYALMSAYGNPPQVATGGPWDTVYFGDIPFHAGVYWPGDVDPSWGQPPSTNQRLIPTRAPLPTGPPSTAVVAGAGVTPSRNSLLPAN